MKKTDQRILRYLDAISDILLIFLACGLAYYFRFDVLDGMMDAFQLAAQPRQQWLNAIYAIALVGMYYFTGRYDRDHPVRVAKEITDVLLPNIVGIIFYAAMLYLGFFPDFSRGAILMMFTLSFVFVVGKRVFFSLLGRHYRRHGFIQKHVVLVGSGSVAKKYLDEVQKNSEYGICVDGYFSDQETGLPIPYAGSISSMASKLSEQDIDEIIVALDWSDSPDMKAIINSCEQSGIRTSIIPYYNDYLPSRPQIEILGECKLINIRTIPLDNMFSAMYKRTLDILVSLFAILVSSPIMLITALAIFLTDPGPIFFNQVRVGKNRKTFRMYKFRSMRMDTNHTGWSTKEDDRRTAVGRIIRKFSIDELPQFFNVLKGDMSLIGPRPELPNFVNQFANEIPRYMIRHQVRPGITGLAQVNGLRGDTDIRERIKCDIWYIENWTWLLDLRILLRTLLGGFINEEKL